MLGIGTDRNLPTVLLIDDDMITREVIATLMTMHGYTLHTAVDGADSLKMLDSKACIPHVILVDVRMEGLSGVELIKELRARSTATIYAMSGVKPPDDLKRAVDGFLLKPFVPEALEKLLSRHMLQADPGGAALADPLISPETLAQFRQMMPESAVRQIYATVASDLKERSTALEIAVAEGNANEVRRLGHAIKGGCGMAGVRQAALLGALLESESDELNNSLKAIRGLQAAAEHLERMLDVEFRT
ncbi:MAG TPA: response regulator [Terracidiphilus sp.]|nr:response regulator [Terracidiphilus sp.]